MLSESNSLLIFITLVRLRCFEFANRNEQCISSPPELKLTQGIDNDGNTIYSGTLRFVPKRFTTEKHGYPTSFTTRVYNGMLPGPTIRLKRGTIYHLRFYNDLSPNHPNDPALLNTFHSPNTTNLHTHGLHISPESPSDDPFHTISPDTNYQYIYYIPCNHNGGTNYYHPHSHGSIALQVGGGAAGALIIEDDDGTIEGIPDWLLSMNELILMIQYMDLERLITWTNLRYDLLTHVDSTELFYLVNGKYKPSICLTVNEWKRLRIIYSDVFFETEITLADPNVCVVYLLAKDGVYTDGTRFISTNTLYFTPSSRIDVAIKCADIGTFELSAWKHDHQLIQNVEFLRIANIIVHPEEDKILSNNRLSVDFDAFKPIRPRYLQSLVDYNADEIDNLYNVVFNGDHLTINGQLFSGADDIEMEVGVNEVNEWRVYNRMGRLLYHPLHVHVNHFELQSGSVLSGSDPNMSLVGDWIDTVAETAMIRFWSDTFGTRIVLHCHMLDHGDLGMMAVYRINGGCDAMDIECIDENADNDCDWTQIMHAKIDHGDQKVRRDDGILMVFVVVAIGTFILGFVLKRNQNKDVEMGVRYRCDYGSTEMDSF